MKKFTLLGICFLLVTALYSQEGFTGPGNRANSRQFRTVTVVEAKNLSDDVLVTLTGNIIRSLGDEKYTFRDTTGDITIEIDRRIWRDLSVGEADMVEISGEVDVERNRVEIDVKSIGKL